MPSTLSEKVWDRHVAHRAKGEPDPPLLDLPPVHEGTSPQAFGGLPMGGRPVRRPERTVPPREPHRPTHRRPD